MTRAPHSKREGLVRARTLVQTLAFASGWALFGAIVPRASAQTQTVDSGTVDSGTDSVPVDSAALDSAAADSAAVDSVSTESSAEPMAAASGPPPADLATVIGLDLTAALPAPLDPGAFPPPPPSGRGPTRPYFELHGFLSTWLTLVQDPVPGVEERDSFRLRFVVLRVDARLSDQVRMLARLGFMAPGNPLLDFEATWEPISEVALSIGQMRMPFGASATTLAPQLVFLDRPRYVQAMLKSTFRDVGLLVHSGARGVFDGVLHYRLAVMNGGGRLGVSMPRGLNEPERFLYVGRVMVDVGRLVTGGARDRLVLGGSYARSRDPAIDTGDLAADRVLADSVLGRRLAPLGLERETQVGGVDLTFSTAGFWAQAEWMYLDSASVDGTAHTRSQGASLELAYTPDWHPYDTASLRVALRGEYFDPSLDRSGDESGTGLAGLDFDATHGVRVGVFGGATIFRDATRGREEAAAELTLRAQYGF
ncbi:MAG: hypothetical protein J0L92_39335 [Deltaproteobacteria bacterium]|nr:hypothetical protein [Deltaproteobacteria bacterium]